MPESLPSREGRQALFFSPKMAISARRLRQLQALLASGREAAFYDWPEWDRTRAQVLALDHWECVMCRQRGRFSPAVLVHHVQHLRDRPELALSIWADGPDGLRGQRQLVSLCKRCHEEQHPEALSSRGAARQPVTVERWD